MGIPIKYSVTKQIGSLKRGNIAIGLGKDGYITSWYNSISPTHGYYVVYETEKV